MDNKRLAAMLFREIVSSFEAEYKEFICGDNNFINGMYLESSVTAYLEEACAIIVALSIHADIASTDNINTLKNHHFFKDYFWIDPQFVGTIHSPIYINAHHQLSCIRRLKEIVEIDGELFAIPEPNDFDGISEVVDVEKIRITRAWRHITPMCSELDVEGTLGGLKRGPKCAVIRALGSHLNPSFRCVIENRILKYDADVLNSKSFRKT